MKFEDYKFDAHYEIKTGNKVGKEEAKFFYKIINKDSKEVVCQFLGETKQDTHHNFIQALKLLGDVIGTPDAWKRVDTIMKS